MEAAGYIRSYWGDEATGDRRRYYAITPAGQLASRRLTEEWKETREIMDKLLEAEEEK